MTFETLDYLTEANRIKAAFDVKGDCGFISLDNITMGLWQNGVSNMALNGHQEARFYCFYIKNEGRTYGVRSPDVSTIIVATSITIQWDNSVRFRVVDDEADFVYGPILAKGLFHLGLLSPEAEAQLRVSITSHQKMEWALEFQRRLGQG